MALNDQIQDALIGHQIGLQRLSSATVRKIVALLNRADARIVQRLLREDITNISRSRQSELLRGLRDIIDSVYTNATGQLQIELQQLAQYEVEYQADMFRRLLPISYETVMPSPNQIIAAVNSRPFQGKILRDWYRDIGDVAKRRIRETIRQGIVEGRTIDQLVRDVRGTRANAFKDGILGINRRNAEAVVRTAVNHTANSARNELYKRNNRLIKAVQFIATLDSRTTLLCAGLDNKIFPVDSGPRPPLHMGCRSTTIPVIKSAREMGLANQPQATRASMNGQVAADTTYSQWLRRQPVSVQNEVLGESKARLFRGGNLGVDRFRDSKGREYTLDELRRREREAWDKAGMDA